MAEYTVVRVFDVENWGPHLDLPEGMEIRFLREEVGSTQLGVSYLRLAPEVHNPFGHRHFKQEEVYVLVKGRAELKLDDEVARARAVDGGAGRADDVARLPRARRRGGDRDRDGRAAERAGGRRGGPRV